jgi:hypothetical protein
VPERFEREYGCSVSEWTQWLSVAAGGNRLTVDAVDAVNAGAAGGGLGGRARIELMRPANAHSGRLEGSAEIAAEFASEPALGANSQPVLVIAWQPLEPRRIALLAIERLHVRFNFSATTESQREEFMRHFDLTMQRGGG